MQRFNDRVTVDTGTTVRWCVSPTVTVYDSGTFNLSSIFDDDIGTPKSNPFTGSPTGRIFFYAADGKYDIVYTGGTPMANDNVAVELLDDTLLLTPSSTGITSLNGIVVASQGLVVGATGTDFNIADAGSNHTFNLPVASSGVTGKLSSADFLDFVSRLKSINGLTAVSQILIVGTAGVNPNISSTVDTHTINLPIASGTKTGVLSSADWMSFSGKQDVIPLGAPTQYIRGDHNLDTLNTDNVPEGSGNLYYSNTRARLALSATAPILYNNSTGMVSSNPATAGQNGYLQATDFIIFNNKMGTLNGLSDVTQSFSTDSGGTDFAISSAAAYHTLKLPSASSTARGLITTGPQTINGPKTFASEVKVQKYIELTEIPTQGLAPADGARLYIRDNGSGKTQLVIIYQSGSTKVLDTEV